MMRINCSWCDSFIGYKPGPDGEVTHGICFECKVKEMAEAKRMANLPSGARAVDMVAAAMEREDRT